MSPAFLRQSTVELRKPRSKPIGVVSRDTRGLAEIDQTASVVLEGASPETRPFIDTKLRELAAEKRRIQERLDELDAVDRPAIDADAVVRSGLAALRDLPRLLESANIEGRKEFVRAFIGGITVRPDTGVLDLQMKKLPALATGNSTCEMVAGAGFEPATFGL